MPARAIASLSLSFGLVWIPVKLYSATESASWIRFNLMGRDGCRVRQHYVTDQDHAEVDRGADEEVPEPDVSRAGQPASKKEDGSDTDPARRLSVPGKGGSADSVTQQDSPAENPAVVERSGAMCSRFRRLAARHLPHDKIVLALARELRGFVWAITRQITHTSSTLQHC